MTELQSKIINSIKAHPYWLDREIAKEVGCNTRTVNRTRHWLNEGCPQRRSVGHPKGTKNLKKREFYPTWPPGITSKQQTILNAITEHPSLSDYKIGSLTNCAHEYVRKVRYWDQAGRPGRATSFVI